MRRALADPSLMLCRVARRRQIQGIGQSRRRVRRLRQWATIALGVGLLSISLQTRAEDSAPFSAHRHEIQGLVRQVWPLGVSECAGERTDLLVLSTDGGPPSQQKWMTWMPCGSALDPEDPRIVKRRLSDATVLVDVALVPGRQGPQLLTISAAGLEIESLGSTGEPIRELAIPGGLPLPPRPWEIGRLPIVDDWNDDTRPTALIPALSGAWLLDLETGEARKIEMPIYASYITYSPFLPATVWKWMIQEVTWPAISRVDDNGDGRPDLFALSRWGIWIYHIGPDGLPSEPSRRIDVIPFDADVERRHQATVNNYFARDLNGDGRADLLLNTIFGGLMNGRSSTRIQINDGTGASLANTPDAVRETEGGLSGFSFVDLDGDGVEEMIETTMDFGIVQMMRILVTRKAKTQVRVLVLDPDSLDGTRTIFKDEFSFSLNFGDSSMSGLIPSIGDWNGDGVQDMFVARGEDEISFRIGSSESGEPVFGKAKGRQAVGLDSGESRIADLNGDGLDDIIAFTDNDPNQPLIVLENAGRLPGTPSSMRTTSK
ncbi:MAG TPA: VCBS repeat-containing protein [Myxococcales bacterium]|nr:VCBS repeat-containing protein [Myxococcales bacterium]HIK83889.1 VCBS repeat-containing protein [Myxococcales bacterium]